MNEKSKALWHSLQPLLDAFVTKVTSSIPGTVCEISNFSSEAFLLRAYATLKKTTDGEEVAITVDAIVKDYVVTLAADACMDSGEVLAEGPVTSLLLSDLSEESIAQWINKFKEFLKFVEPIIITRTSRLV
jgi:hypothetical protein